MKVAIVGIGWAGSRHAEAIKELAATAPAGTEPPLNVEMLVDSDPDHLKTKATEFGVARTSTSLEEALSDPGIDAVSIATPHPLHRDAAIAAANAGKHVMVEKPMAVTVEDATAMIDAAEANNVRIYVAENVCYGAMSTLLREMVSAKQYTGDLTFASVVAGFRAEPRYSYPGRRAWLADPGAGGSGTWLLHGVHTLAQLRFVLGEVETIYVRESHTPSFQTPEVEGTMSALLGMESGLSVALVQSCETKFTRDQVGYTLYGERGSIKSTRDGIEVYSTDVYPDLDQPLHVAYPGQSLSDYALEWQAFADYVTTGAEGPTTGRSERRTLAVVQAGYESASTDQPVNLRERFRDI